MTLTLSLASDPAQTVTIPMPSSLTNVSSNDIEHYLFGDGTYATSDDGDAGETIILNGILQSDDLSTDIQGFMGQSVVITGLPDGNLDGTYLMEDFDVNYLSGPDYPEWTLSLRKI